MVILCIKKLELAVVFVFRLLKALLKQQYLTVIYMFILIILLNIGVVFSFFELYWRDIDILLRHWLELLRLMISLLKILFLLLRYIFMQPSEIIHELANFIFFLIQFK